MQVKKFEAATIQEALETIKRELGPEAIILQTKQNKKGFGLMNKASVEVTAAVSERSLQKKSFTEKRLPEPSRDAVQRLPANRQAQIYDKNYDKYVDRQTEKEASQAEHASRQVRDQVQLQSRTGLAARQAAAPAATAAPNRAPSMPSSPPQARTASAASRPAPRVTRYADIDAEEVAARPQLPPSVVGYGMPIEEEVRHLKRMMEEMKISQEESQFGAGARGEPGPRAGSLESPALMDAFEQLVLGGVDRRYALTLVRKVGFDLGASRAEDPDQVLDALAGEIMQGTEVLAPLHAVKPRASQTPQTETAAGPVLLALVGPTGVGKTTTLAKIASLALLKLNLRVGLINVDAYKVAAFDQLATYAKILNVPFRSAASAEDFRAAVRDFQGLDVVLIDTTGRSQKDPDSLKEMQTLLNAVPGIQTYLVLSSTTRDTELYDQANRFAMFLPQAIVASKLDEANIYGSIYNVSQRAKLPLAYFTTGQRVPEDIEEASRERLAALVMHL